MHFYGGQVLGQRHVIYTGATVTKFVLLLPTGYNKCNVGLISVIKIKGGGGDIYYFKIFLNWTVWGILLYSDILR